MSSFWEKGWGEGGLERPQGWEPARLVDITPLAEARLPRAPVSPQVCKPLRAPWVLGCDGSKESSGTGTS